MARARAVAVVAVCLLGGLYLEGHRPVGYAPPADTPAGMPVAAESTDPLPPPDPFPPVETPYRVVLTALPREAFPDVEQQGSTVRVSYRLDGSMMTMATGRRAFDQNVVQIVPELFARFPAISAVEMDADAPTIDVRGNSGRGLTASVTFTRRNARTIRWKAIDSSSIEQLADRVWYGAGFH